MFFFDNESGADPREKIRIRIYNGDINNIHLEFKRKERDRTLKRSCPISLEQVRDIIYGDGLKYDDNLGPLLKKLYVLQETKRMVPKTIEEYDRVPFVCDSGNVRVTLDLNIRSSSDVDSFLSRETSCRPIMARGNNILKVKYDELLPDYIYHTVQMQDLNRVAFSKYYLCRKFGG